MQADFNETPSIKARAFSALRWAGGAWVIGQLITLGVALIVIRLLSPKDFGLMALAAVLVELVTLLSSLGLPVVLVQMATLPQGVIKKIFGAVILSRIVFFATLQLLAFFIGWFFGQDLAPVIRVLSFTLLISALSEVPEALMRRELDFETVSKVELFSIICYNLSALLMALLGYGVWALVSGHLVAALMRTIGILSLSKLWMLPDFRITGLSAEFRFGLQVALKTIVANFNRQIDSIIIGKTLGTMQLGYYNVATQLARFSEGIVLLPISRVCLSAFSRLGDDIQKVKHYFLRALEIILLFFFPVCWGLSVTAQDLVRVAFGERWVEVIPVLQIIVLIVPLNAILRLLTPILDAQGHPDISLSNQVTTAISLIPTIWIGTMWGLPGTSIGLVTGYLIATCINLRRSLATLYISAADFGRVICPIAAAATVMYLSVWLGKSYLYNEMTAPWRLAASIFVGALVYCSTVFVFNRGAVFRAKEFLRA